MARKWVRRVLLGMGGLVLVVALAAVVLLATPMGARLALSVALPRVAGLFDGEITVGDIGTTGLWSNVTLRDVAVSDVDGQPAVAIDTVSVRYRLLDVARGRVQLSDVEISGARVFVTQLPGQDRVNLERIFVPDRRPQEDTVSADGPSSLVVTLTALDVRNVHVVVRIPAGDDPDSLGQVLEAVPGGLVRRIEVSGLEARIPEARIVEPGQAGEFIQVERLTGDVRVFPTPFRIEGLAGSIQHAGPTVSFDGSITVGQSGFEGTAEVDWGGPSLEYDVTLDSDRFDPSDFAFAEPRLPSGLGQGRITARSAGGEATYTLADASVNVGRSQIRGGATVHVGPEPSIRLEGVDLDLAPLDLDLLDDWTDDLVPVPLDLTGRIRADGPLDDVAVVAQVDVTSPENRFGASRVGVDGRIRLEAPFGAGALDLDAPTLDLALVQAFWPPLPLTGAARARGRIEGTFTSALDLDLTLQHLLAPGRTTRVRYVGGVVTNPDDLRLDGDLTLNPLFLPTLEPVNPIFAADEVATGSIELAGPLTDLRISADLETSAGGLAGTARVNGSDLAAGYEVDMTLSDFDPAPFLPAFDTASISGRVRLDLAGLEPTDLEGSAAADLGTSTLLGITFDSASISADFQDGYATVDSSRVWAAGATMLADGTAALVDSLPPGGLEVAASIPSLALFVDRIMPAGAEESDPNGDEDSDPTAFDGETPPDVEGTDRAEPAPVNDEPSLFAGAVEGNVVLAIAGARIDGTGELVARTIEAGPFDTDSADVRFRGTDLVSPERLADLQVDVGPFELGGRPFDRAGIGLDWIDGGVDFDLRAALGDSVRHHYAGRFDGSDSLAAVTLEQASVGLNQIQARLTAPGSIAWSDAGLAVERLEMIFREDPERHLIVEGTLPRQGTVDFKADLKGVDLTTLSGLLSLPERLEGTLGADLAISGPSANPVLRASLSVDDLAFRGESLPRLGVTAAYAARNVAVALDASENGRSLLDIDLDVPLDLAANAQVRVPDEPISGSFSAHAFPLGLVATFPGVLEDVHGTITGDLDVGGRIRAPRSYGSLVLEGGTAYLPDLGITPTAAGAVTLDGDGLLSVDMEIQSRGTTRLTGTLDLREPTQLGFDLEATADTFLALNRRDVTASVSGPLTLGGTLAEPRITGDMRTRNTTLRLDEFASSRRAINVAEADFYTVVDTSVFVTGISDAPTLIERASIDLGLALGRGSWLRSRDITAELGGGFRITHEPFEPFRINGELRTIRGSYSGFGKSFQIVEGSILFAGSRTFDPVLNIVAMTRVRSSEQALDIFATLGGTATAPEVTLSSNAEPPMVEEELISYLVFGRPSHQLGSGENAVVSGVSGAASSMALGMMANELGTALGSSIDMFDYFSISAPQEAAQYGQGEATRSSIASTQVEFGQYLSETLFLAATFRPLDASNQFAGARLEWRFSDGARLEVFLEDRLARSPSATFGDLGFTLEQSLGMSLAKEWIY